MTEPEWPDAVHLLHLFAQATGPDARVRDAGILVAVASRPRATLLESVVYPTVLHQAAALLHGSLAWRPLTLWNAGLGWAAALTLLTRSGFNLSISAWEQMVVTDEITRGDLDAVSDIAVRLGPFLTLR
jgi:death-on-curing protein